MTKISARTLNFFDRYVVGLIMEKYRLPELHAFRSFIESETYQMLINPELEIYRFSPVIVFDMWESEQVTGNPRNSPYLRSDEPIAESQKEVEFFNYLIERYAEFKNTNAAEVLKQWDALELTHFIFDMYEMYHIERLENAFDDIDELIAEKLKKA